MGEYDFKKDSFKDFLKKKEAQIHIRTDKGIQFLVDIAGNSNSGNFTFTIPFNPNFTIIIPCGQVVNNSITQSAVGTAFITSGSSTITIAANPQGSTFVGSGTKSFKGGFFIKK